MKEKLTVVIECEGMDSGTAYDIFEAILRTSDKPSIIDANVSGEHYETNEHYSQDLGHIVNMVNLDIIENKVKGGGN